MNEYSSLSLSPSDGGKREICSGLLCLPMTAMAAMDGVWEASMAGMSKAEDDSAHNR